MRLTLIDEDQHGLGDHAVCCGNQQCLPPLSRKRGTSISGSGHKRQSGPSVRLRGTARPRGEVKIAFIIARKEIM